MAYIQTQGSDGSTYTTSCVNATVIAIRGIGGVDARIYARGVVKEFDVWVYVSGDAPSVKMKVFRDDGTNWVFIGQTPLTAVVNGYNLIRAFIPVEYGDYIGVYYNNLYIRGRTDGSGDSGACVYRSGDVTLTYAKSTWNNTSDRVVAARARVFTRVGII
jgi:hypothetical protein